MSHRKTLSQINEIILDIDPKLKDPDRTEIHLQYDHMKEDLSNGRPGHSVSHARTFISDIRGMKDHYSQTPGVNTELEELENLLYKYCNEA